MFVGVTHGHVISRGYVRNCGCLAKMRDGTFVKALSVALDFGLTYALWNSHASAGWTVIQIETKWIFDRLILISSIILKYPYWCDLG